MFIQVLFFVVSVSLTLILMVYGFNHYYLLTASRHYRLPRLQQLKGSLPTVCVHLPIYNEKYIVRRLVQACAEMAARYDRSKVRILLLDDSTDDTYEEARKITAEYSARGYHIELIHRDNRQGFKAGALQEALARTTEDYIALFDADFIPEADFLDRTIPYFIQDPHLGIVQSRWCHLNRDYNLLTFAVAIAIDIHFVVEQPGRYASGLYQNFNGSGGVLRKKAILEAGGWQSDTLTEDLDLSYRMQLNDYKMLYIKDLDSPAELPPTVPSFKQQQGRWANGSLRTARKILPQIIRKSGLSFRHRLQAVIHLTGYLIHPLMTISFILACIGTLANLNNMNYMELYVISQVQGLLNFGRALAILGDKRLKKAPEVPTAKELGIDAEFAGQLKHARARLYPFKIGHKGDLQEWFQDWDSPDPHHRHFSHLIGLFPKDPHRILSVLGLQNGIPEFPQHVPGHQPDVRAVLHQKDRFAASGRRRECGRRLRLVPRRHPRQVKAKRRARVHFAFQLDSIQRIALVQRGVRVPGTPCAFIRGHAEERRRATSG